MRMYRIAVFVASLVLTTTTTASEQTDVPKVAMQPAPSQVIDRTGAPDENKVCYHAGDRNGFETCTDIDRRDCSALANGTLIC